MDFQLLVIEWKRQWSDVFREPEIITRYGIKQITFRNNENKVHRIGAPAYYEVDVVTGQILLEHYIVNGDFYNYDDEPSVIQRHTTGKLHIIKWHKTNIDYDKPESIKWYGNGNICNMQYRMIDGKYHTKGDIPAYISYYLDGKEYELIYYKYGCISRHHKKGPARIKYHPNGNIECIEYKYNDKYMRPPEDGPHYISYFETGQIEFMEYTTKDPKGTKSIQLNLNGIVILKEYKIKRKAHRDPERGPAVTKRYDDGTIKCIGYLWEGKYHRDAKQGPALITYFEDGTIESMHYKYNNKFHRHPRYGPAFIEWNSDGTKKKQEVYIYHGKITKHTKW